MNDKRKLLVDFLEFVTENYIQFDEVMFLRKPESKDSARYIRHYPGEVIDEFFKKYPTHKNDNLDARTD